jgi:hypothetical protein
MADVILRAGTLTDGVRLPGSRADVGAFSVDFRKPDDFIREVEDFLG